MLLKFQVDTREQSVLVLIEPSVVEKLVEKESKCAACEARKLEPPQTLRLSPAVPPQTLRLSPAEPPQILRLSPSPTPQSRIPRLAAGSKSPASPVSPVGKRPFHRQDTYTKIHSQPVLKEDSDDRYVYDVLKVFSQCVYFIENNYQFHFSISWKILPIYIQLMA